MIQFDFAVTRMHILTIGLIVVLIALAVVLTWYVGVRTEKQELGTDAAATLIDSEATPYRDLGGEPFHFSDLRGQVRVVNVWASWSPHSVDELVQLQAISEQYADSNVVVVAINRKEPTHRIEAFLQQYSQDMSSLRIVVDETDAFYKNSGGYAMPETLVYDANGNLYEHIRGPVEDVYLRQIIDSLLQ